MKRRTLTLALLLPATLVGLVCVRISSAALEPQQRRATTQRRAPARTQRPGVDYTKFTHTTAAHRKDSCDSCHKSPSDNWAQVRDAAAAFPDITDYPEHESCLSCHRQQFFKGARPAICSVCHTVVSPRAGARFPFARSEKAKTSASEFALNFPHDIHQDVMARAPQRVEEDGVRFVRTAFVQEPAKPSKPNSCSVCHQTYTLQPAAAPTPVPAGAKVGAGAGFPALPAGLLKTTPTGHESCFNCHWQEGGEKPLSTDCAGCHKLLPVGTAARPALAGKDADPQLAARAGFTDPYIVRKLLRRDSVIFAHEEERHREIDCATCHTRIPALNTLDELTLKVPILSCGAGSSCHIGAKPKRILNEEVDKKLADSNFQCVKCHYNLGRQKPPQSHLDATGK
ncbi:MAG: cytochrome c3 family protein [Pyrinomonadaceae bacterium]